MLKVVFFGTSKYCLPVLECLKSNLKLVVVTPDKPVGRKHIPTPCATKVWATRNNVPFDTALTTDCDLAIVADYGQMIKKEVFERPRFGTFNIHFSKLPDLRGASPVQQTILRGDTTAWVTIFKIEETLDTGPILDQRSFPILPTETTEELYTRLFEEVAKYLPGLIQSLVNGHLSLVPQTGNATYCKKLTREDGFVEFSSVLEPRTYNLFRAMFPWPGLWTLRQTQGKPQRMKILKCHLEGNKLVLDLIQFDGEKPKLIKHEVL